MLLPYDIEIDSVCNKPEVFPLQLSLPFKLDTRNKYLVGESAHSLHPVGGQGLNLCLRDVNDLSYLIRNNILNEALPTRV